MLAKHMRRKGISRQSSSLAKVSSSMVRNLSRIEMHMRSLALTLAFITATLCCAAQVASAADADRKKWEQIESLRDRYLPLPFHSPEAAEERRAAKVGEAYISKKFPDFKHKDWSLVILDAGIEWEVTYFPPNNAEGGGPSVFLEKRSLKVLRTVQYQ
jgi:hypothetical protein